MSANIYTVVPVPVGDGTGAPVSVAQQGLKTFVIGGNFDATVIIEIGVQGRFAPVLKVDKASQIRNVRVVAEDVRVRVVGYRSGAPTVMVGADPAINQFGILDVPAGVGVGTPLDTALFGGDKTILLDGIFQAKVTFEVSEDIAGEYVSIGNIDRANNFISQNFVSRFIRARVSAYNSGAPIAAVGAADLDAAGAADPALTVPVACAYVSITGALFGANRGIASAQNDSLGRYRVFTTDPDLFSGNSHCQATGQGTQFTSMLISPPPFAGAAFAYSISCFNAAGGLKNPSAFNVVIWRIE
jgi:hypothetical protein